MPTRQRLSKSPGTKGTRFFVPLRLLPYAWWCAGLQAAIDTTASRNSISQITNLGTASNNLTQSTKANQPSLTQSRNGRPTALFASASSQSLALSNLAIAQNISNLYVISAFQNIATDNANLMLSVTANIATSTRLNASSSVSGTNGFNLSGKRLDADSSFVTATGSSNKSAEWQLGEWLAAYATGQTFCYQNRVQVSNTSTGSSGATSNTASSQGFVGRTATTGTPVYSNMNLGEEVVLQKNPSADERLLLQNYFSKRWTLFGGSAISISQPTTYTTYQRNSSNQANLTISGTYVGTPTAIEARFNGGTWATIVASPSGGSYTGTLSAQSAGQGNLEVRFTNNTAIATAVPFVGIGDVYIVAGQSNAVGRGTSNQTYTGTQRACLLGNDGNWKNLSDPYDSPTGQLDTVSMDDIASGNPAAGSWVPLLATSHLAARSCPIAFVPCAKSSTKISQWQPGSSHTDRSTLYGSMIYRYQQLPTGARAVLWWQGESDANATPPTDGTTYQAGLEAVANAIATDTGLKMYVVQLQNSTGITDANEAVIRSAITSAIAANTNIKIGADVSDQTSDDSYHLKTNAKLQLVADRFWTILSAAFP